MGTAESIAIHASKRPEAIALSLGDREISYATLDADVRAAVRALTALGVSRGKLVAIGVDDPYTHCLLIIALEQLGAGAGSFASNEGELAAALLSRVDLVLAVSALGIDGTRPLHILPPDWLAKFRGSEIAAAPASQGHADDPIRITRTSGTTGVTKTLIVPRRQLDARLERYAGSYGFDTGSRFLVSMTLSVFPVYASAMACLRSGGTVVFAMEPGLPTAPILARRGITHIALTPLHLRAILSELPADYAKPERFTIYAFAAGLSAALRAQALERLATRVLSSYGSNETGVIAIMQPEDEEGTGTIWRTVDVEIVDENGAPLPMGAIGRIRVRSPFVVNGYLDDPEATRRMFRDGWFYPGDSGVIDVPGRLRVLGRTDDLLNIGGVKYPPEDLERLVAHEAAVLDVGVCAVRNSEGIDEVCVAVVVKDVKSDAELRDRVLRTLHDLRLGLIWIVRFDAIPRNAIGKIMRDRLREAVRRALPQR